VSADRRPAAGREARSRDGPTSGAIVDIGRELTPPLAQAAGEVSAVCTGMLCRDRRWRVNRPSFRSARFKW
jgi:hypothetical protein